MIHDYRYAMAAERRRQMLADAEDYRRARQARPHRRGRGRRSARRSADRDRPAVLRDGPEVLIRQAS